MNTKSTPFNFLRVAVFFACVGGPLCGAVQAQSREPQIIIHQRDGKVVGEREAEAVPEAEPQAPATPAELERAYADSVRKMERLEKSLIKAAEAIKAQKTELAEERTRSRDLATRSGKLETLARRQKKALEQAMEEAERTTSEIETLKEEIRVQQAHLEEGDREAEVLKQALARSQEAAAAMPGETTAGPLGATLDKAHRLLAAGNIEEAAELFRKGIARWPDEVAFQIGLASCHYSGGRLEVAKSLLEDVLDQDSRQAEAHGLLGLIYWQEEDLKEASRRLAKAIREQPENDRWLVYLGMVTYARGRTSDAFKSFEKAIEANPLNPEARFNLSILLAGEEEPDLIQARAQYEEALRLGSDPDPELEKVIYAD